MSRARSPRWGASAAATAPRSEIFRGQRVHGLDRGADGQRVAVPVEDRPALRPERDGLRVLPLGEPGELVVADDLQVPQPDDYGPEEERRDSRSGRARGFDSGTQTPSWCPDEGGCGHRGIRFRRMARPSGCAPTITATSPWPVEPVFPVPDHGRGLAGARHEMIKVARSCPSRFPLPLGATCCGWPRPARRTPARARTWSGAGGVSPRRRAAESTRANARSDGQLQLELPVLLLQPSTGGSERLQPVRDSHPLHLEPHVAEHAADEHAPRHSIPAMARSRRRSRSRTNVVDWSWISRVMTSRTSLEHPESRAPGSGVGVDLIVAGTERLSRRASASRSGRAAGRRCLTRRSSRE